MANPAVRESIRQLPYFLRWPPLWLALLAIVVRIPGIDRPLLGNFATKNVVYAMIARNWVEGRAGLLHPTLDVMVGGQRSLHLLEFPASAYFSGWLWSVMGGSLDVWGRVTAVGFMVAAVLLLYRFVHGRHGRHAAMGAALTLAISPVSILVGQSFMLEASLVLFTVAAFFAQDRWLAGGRIHWLLLTCLSTALALLTKIYMLVWLVPLFMDVSGVPRSARKARQSPSPMCHEKAQEPKNILTSSFVRLAHSCGKLTGPNKTGTGSRRIHEEPPSKQCARVPVPVLLGPLSCLRMPSARQLAAWAALGLATLPAAFWYWHAAATAAPDGPFAEHVFYSVRQSAAVHRPPHPLLTTADFYRQILDDLAGVVLTPIGLTLALAGLLHAAWRRYATWLGASALLLAALPLKFYEMNYYWLPVLPAMGMLVGLGWQRVCRGLRPGRMARAAVLLVSLLFAVRYAAKPAFVTPAEDRAVVPAGRAIQGVAGPDEPVVTMHGTAIDLLYYCNRPGWALPPDAPDLASVLAARQAEAVRWLVFVGADNTAPPELADFPISIQGPGYAVYNLGVQRPQGRIQP